MTDSNATELLRKLLDERGVEWRKWTKSGKRGFSNVETCWFVPSDATKLGESFFCKATVCVNHPEGPLHYKGYVVSPQAAIEASLGKADDASANGAALEKFKELRDLACDIHAAEIIDHVHITHRGWTFDSQWLDSWHNEFDQLADKLEQAVAATLGAGECKIVASSTDGLCTDNPKHWFKLSCGHSVTVDGLEKPVACAVCGKAVKR